MSSLAIDGAMEIYAWVLMPNHFHLLCKTKNLPLAYTMRRLLSVRRPKKGSRARQVCNVIDWS